MRIAAGVEYDGSGFAGWQWQSGVRTVQQCVERALSVVADERIRVVPAGRTDAGVHACCQVIHFDTTRTRTEYAWVRGTTSSLPNDVALLWARPVAQDFHARFSALERRYRYLILNRPIRPTSLAGRVAWIYRPLDVERMQAAARYLVGRHDFSSFRAKHCQAKSPVRELRRLEVSRRGALVCIEAAADAFLYRMVRNLAGVLIEVGAGRRPPEWAREVLEAGERECAGVTAPAHGLYLAGIDYPERYGLPCEQEPCGIG